MIIKLSFTLMLLSAATYLLHALIDVEKTIFSEENQNFLNTLSERLLQCTVIILGAFIIVFITSLIYMTIIT